MIGDKGVEVGSLLTRVRATKAGASWDAQWRYRSSPGEGWRFKRKTLGRAWQEPDGEGSWRKRRGRCPAGWMDERSATVASLEAMEQHRLALTGEAVRAWERQHHKVTVRELSHEWLSWLEEVKGAAPSTIKDYGFLLREPGTKYRRGGRTSAGWIIGAFGDRAAEQVTTREVSDFLRKLDKAGLKPRNVNKHRQTLSAIFNYGSRDDTYQLPKNPAAGTDQRFEEPPAALDYYEVHEVETLAGAAARGAHRWTSRLYGNLERLGSLQGAATASRVSRAAVAAEIEVNPVFAQQISRIPGALEAATDPTADGWDEKGVIEDPDEIAARVQEDRRDAETFRLLFYTGLRLGEVLALRVGDVNLSERLILVRRALSGGTEKNYPKGRRHRFVPLSVPAVETVARLLDRHDFLGSDDYVLCNRMGRRLEPSALRRRYYAARRTAGLRAVRLHGLRHAAGSLIARTSDPVFVRDFLGHSKLATTNRYLSAKLRPEEFERLDRAFGVMSPKDAANVEQ
jgi:integrase